MVPSGSRGAELEVAPGLSCGIASATLGGGRVVLVYVVLSPRWAGEGRAKFVGLNLASGLRKADTKGYAAVDAMVALLILSMAIVFSLQAANQALRIADIVLENHRAKSLLTRLIESAPRGFEDEVGESDGFSWQANLAQTGAERPVAICRHEVRLSSINSKRTYRATRLEICPLESAA